MGGKALLHKSGALHLLIGSTGVTGEGEWLAKKLGLPKPRAWRKVHLGIGAETLGIRAVEVTGSRVAEAPMLPDLPDQITGDAPHGIVPADGAQDTRACPAAIAARGAAVIPARRSGNPLKEHTAGVIARNEVFRNRHCLGLAIRTRWTGYL